nr:family 16 glycosylhydrolase [Polymorphobacter multimanifer]
MAAAVLGVGAAPAPAPLPPKSFFEPFDRIDTRRWYISDGWVNGAWHGCTWARSNVGVQAGVLKLRLTQAPNRLRPYKCAEIRTWGRYGHGLYEARMRAAAGAGLNTAMFTYSGLPLTPVHDEVDFEFLGKSPDKVQLNVFVNGKGGRESLEAVGGDASAEFHDYAVEWTPTAIRWFIDGTLVRTETRAPLPNVPGQLFLSLWMGAKPVEDWLGKFVDPRPAISADIDWIAFTAPGERCAFPQSLSCRYP